MTQMITAKDLAKLHLELEVPSFVAHVMERHEELSQADEQALSYMMSQMNSLETLISTACCFHIFTAHLQEDVALFEPLLQHADYILDDYAPYWMKKNFPRDEEWTNFIHDDLETLGDLLCLLSDASHGQHPALREICDLLNEHVFLKSLNIDLPVAQAAIIADNIIRFPVERRR